MRTEVVKQSALALTIGMIVGCAGDAPFALEETDLPAIFLDDIEIPAGFDFATTHDVTVSLALGPRSGDWQDPPRVHVGVDGEGGDFDLIMEGFLSEGGTFVTVIPVATRTESLVVKYETLDGVTTLRLPIVDASAVYPGPTLASSMASGGITPALNQTGQAGGPMRVPEDLSNFPIAYVSYHPSQSAYGTIAFEDNWPWKGDYDFNDLVLSYHIVQYRNPSYDMVAMEVFVRVEAVGAEFRNGFGFGLPISRQRVITAYGGVSARADELGMEPGHDEAVFILFDNPSAVVGREATMMNTLPGKSLVDVPELRFVVQFRTPLKDSEMGTPPINPFLFVNGDRGREIHLIGKPATDLASSAYPGSGDDSGAYSTQTGLPWAILLPTSWAWPAERVPVHEGHLEFVPWAESGGTTYTDWYLSKGNNRDEAQLILR